MVVRTFFVIVTVKRAATVADSLSIRMELLLVALGQRLAAAEGSTLVSREMFAAETVVTVLCTALIFVAEYLGEFGEVNLLRISLAL